MSDNAPQLTHELLDRFRAALAAAGAPIASAIESGLTDAQVDQLAGELGVQVPPELRTLWTWGTVAESTADPRAWDINPQFVLWHPSEAVRQTKLHREDPHVSRTTISFGGPSGAGHLLVEGDACTAPSKVTYALVDDPEAFEAAPSLGALFELWTTQLETGEYSYVAGQWHDPGDALVFIPGNGD